MIDMASVYAERYKQNPQALQAAVMGQSPDPKLDPYTALNALRLVKESNMMAMSGKAQQPTSSPSIVAETMAPPTPQQGLGAMMPMGAPAARLPPQPQMAQAPQGPMQMASGGLAGMYTPEENYAVGGIVAFDGTNGSFVRDPNSGSDMLVLESEVNDADTDVGTGDATKQFNAMLMKQIANMQGKRAKTTNPAEQKTLFEEFLRRETNLAGPDIYEGEIKQGAQDETDRGKRRNTGEAMALLTAAGRVLKGNTLAAGAGEALPAYAQQMNEVDRADQAARDANKKMQFALKDAQRKERTGNIRAATASMENYRKFQQDENKAEFDRDNAEAKLAAEGIKGNRPLRGGAGGDKGPKLAEQLYADNVDNLMKTTKPKQGEPQDVFAARIRAQAGALTAQQVKTTFSTGEIGGVNAATRLAPVQATIDNKVNEALQQFKSTDPAGSAYRAALRKDRRDNTNEAGILLQTEEDRLRGVYRRSEAATGASAGAPKSTAAPKLSATSTTVTMADVDATVAASGKTKQEVMKALEARGFTVK